ncbi:40S ribosomal protein S3A, putative [Ixodes scapularis]|uniref:Small ribosomal subunit protein eS1 n=1 Tax=Ixodes scapularis TaxID=6945 RepID=B7PSQ6_IXOSC|nr:40S ribosomal protein S3A, putative [Ixodes scapularis]|eukprot:XP_002402816.1 40S ribosomal protein S3A, putative [Ixodes scapularis]
MAVGKNKGLSKGGKKGVKKKIVDPFTRKDWYDVKAPTMYTVRNIGKTFVNRTQGTKIASEGLKGRVFEVSQADLTNGEDAYRKFRLIAEEVQGRNVLTNFHGMDLTTDKLRSMVKKWQVALKAALYMLLQDGAFLRLHCHYLRFQNPRKRWIFENNCFVRVLSRGGCAISTAESHSENIKDTIFRNICIPGSIGKDIEKSCQHIYPLHDVLIRKVKVLKKPKFELGKLLELHGEGTSKGGAASTAAVAKGEEGVKVDRPEGYEPPVLETV